MGNVPTATASQTEVRRRAPWPIRPGKFMRPDRPCESHPLHAPTAGFVDPAGLRQLGEANTRVLKFQYKDHS
jgi:hypothetical protein